MTRRCQICVTPPAFPLAGASFSRRGFFRLGALGLAGWYTGSAFSQSLMERASGVAPRLHGTARNCVLIFLEGAPSQSDLWDLKEGSWTPQTLAPTSYGDVRWPQGFLGRTAAHLDKLAIVRTGMSWVAVHPLAQRWTQIARNPAGILGSIAPHIGSVVAIESAAKRRDSDVLPSFIALDPARASSGYFSASNAPLTLRAPNGPGAIATMTHRDGADRLEQRLELLSALDPDRSGALGKSASDFAALYEGAERLTKSPEIAALFTVGQADYTRYGKSKIGAELIIARQLVGADRGTRFVQATFAGWDDHSNLYGNYVTRCIAFDTAFAAFLGDLAAAPGSAAGRTLLDETLVVVYAEFGRTLGPLNAQRGRDHHQRMSVVFAGGGVRGSRIIGRTSALGDAAVEYGWSADRDVRPEDVASTIYSALDIDYTITRHDDPLGRGYEYVPLASEGTYQPISELFAD
ncbi:MAG TPA: DUF1501 domain-containing protein [Thermoanaerobaculia bacterium]|nr:DUF1501 domain-containing protein [Thermoanaerobaculia bacterium]